MAVFTDILPKWTRQERSALRLATLPRAHRAEFVSALQARNLCLKLNAGAHHRGIVADKLLMEGLMRGMGYPVPNTQALYGIKKLTGRFRALSDAAALENFLREGATYPLFGKPVNRQRSEGCVLIERIALKTGALVFTDGTRKPIGQFVRQTERHHRRWGYLFQSQIQQHAEVEAVLGKSVGCLRIVTLLQRGQAVPIQTLWKIPRAHAIADSIWRGAGLATLDENGRVTAAIDNLGEDRSPLTHHPDSGVALTGFKIPNWEASIAKICDAAELIHGLPLIGWDVAIGEQGPVIVEANTTPALDLEQYITGTGFLAKGRGAHLNRLIREQARRLKNQRRRRRRERQKIALRYLSGKAG